LLLKTPHLSLEVCRIYHENFAWSQRAELSNYSHYFT
jgi:hypothetical protein